MLHAADTAWRAQDAAGGPSPRIVGRYALYEVIATGGMASVHVGRLMGPAGFSRTVAIKRLHPQFAHSPEFVSMLLDEARLAARIRHPNVVPTLDVVAAADELFLIMDFVQGESLASLLRELGQRGAAVPPSIATSILADCLHGLQAAHEARDEQGRPLGIVHRDVSPQNVLVGVDGMARVLDFGIAKAIGRYHTTRDGQIKGKLAYMAPEQLGAEHVTRHADVYAAAVVAWETLTGKRLFAGDSDTIVLARVMAGHIQPPSRVLPDLAPFDDVVMRGLARDPSARWDTAREMAAALEGCGPRASHGEVAAWLESVAASRLRARADQVARIERASGPRTPIGIASAADAAIETFDVNLPPRLHQRRLSVWGLVAFVLAGGIAAAALLGIRNASGNRRDAAALAATTITPPAQTELPSAAAPPAPEPSAAPSVAASSVASDAPPLATSRPTARASGTPPASSAGSKRRSANDPFRGFGGRQ